MKKALSVIIFGVLIFTFQNGTASAWTYGLTGSGQCQPDGSYKITWTVDNRTEREALNIKHSSNPGVVPTGDGAVAAFQKKDFYQTADGTKPGSFSLSLKANWKSDSTKRERTATVNLQEACKQPVTETTPPVGGQGGGVVQSTQVVAPVGAVNAGEASFNASYLLGLAGSIAIAAYGLRRLQRSI